MHVTHARARVANTSQQRPLHDTCKVKCAARYQHAWFSALPTAWHAPCRARRGCRTRPVFSGPLRVAALQLTRLQSHLKLGVVDREGASGHMQKLEGCRARSSGGDTTHAQAKVAGVGSAYGSTRAQAGAAHTVSSWRPPAAGLHVQLGRLGQQDGGSRMGQPGALHERGANSMRAPCSWVPTSRRWVHALKLVQLACTTVVHAVQHPACGAFIMWSTCACMHPIRMDRCR
jgi:hypothetical protein